MTKRILISTIIPSYNRADTVGQTIESILAQQVDADMEIVIGDDCSTDNAREVLLYYKEKYPDIIRLIFHEHNMGLGANWATCVKACKGKYICNCDNDDYWHNPHKLQLQTDYMESHPDSNILMTDWRDLERHTGRTKDEKAYFDRQVSPQNAIMWGHYHICNATIMYRADFLKANVNLDDYIRCQFTLQDWNTWVILCAKTTFDILPVSTATMCRDSESITRPKTYEQLTKRLLKEKECVEYLGELFPQYRLAEGEWDELMARRLLDLAYKRKEYKHAHKYALQIGTKSLKTVCAKTSIGFILYLLLRKMRRLCTR